MLKILDVDWESGFELELVFSDGFKGTADLTDTFQSAPFNSVEDFCAFSLESTCLDWDGIELSANKLRELADNNGEYIDERPISATDMEAIIKQAMWDAVVSNRPDILQAAIRSFVEEYGVQKVQEKTQLKSRPSVYKALDRNNSPKLDTLIQLSHAVFELKHELSTTAANDEVIAKPVRA